MTFMMTPSNDDKSDICQFFYQDLFHIVNTVYVQNFMQNGQKFSQIQKPSPGRIKRHELFNKISQTNLETSTAWNVLTYGVFPGLYFSAFSPNTGKYGPEKTPYLDTFHAVSRTHNSISSKLPSQELQSVLRTVSKFRCMMFTWNKLTPLQLPS